MSDAIDKAREHLEQVQSQMPNNLESKFGKRSSRILGHYAAALDCLEAAVARDPRIKNTKAWNKFEEAVK